VREEERRNAHSVWKGNPRGRCLLGKGESVMDSSGYGYGIVKGHFEHGNKDLLSR
jgi:hypothetical protein